MIEVTAQAHGDYQSVGGGRSGYPDAQPLWRHLSHQQVTTVDISAGLLVIIGNILKSFSSASSLHISWNTSSSKKRTLHKSDRKIKTKKTKVKNPYDGNLRHGADVNAEDVQHKTALHYAVQEHRLDTTKVNRARRERG